jgi:serine/threonine protein kinase
MTSPLHHGLPDAQSWIGQMIGNYRLVRLLGEGGMGMVFEAVHDGVGGKAAIKILRPEISMQANLAARFFNEARAANAIQHPGIVRVFDCGYTQNRAAYLTMEFLAGESLRSRLERAIRLPVPDATRIGRQISSALVASHRTGIVHRDLKPDNVMLVADPELPDGERVKVLDFGIAKMAENLGGRPNATDSNVVMGTPAYMSPEQCKGAKLVTDRADVYSLGIMMYQMLAGRPPFMAEAAGELLIMQVTEPVPPLDGFVPETEPSLVHLIHSMLAKESTTRPSMDAIMAALQQIEKRALAAQSTDQDSTQRLSPVQLRSSIVPTPKQASGDRALAVHSSLNGSSAGVDPPPPKFHNSTVTDAASEATRGKRRTRKRSVALVSLLGVALAGSLLIYRATRPQPKPIAVSQETVNPPGPVTVQTVVKTQELVPPPPTPPTPPAEAKKASTPKNDSSNGKQDQSPPPKPPIVPIPKSDPHLLEARKFFEARKYIEAMYEAQLCGPGKETRFQCNLIRGRAACRLDNRTDAQAVINEFNQSQRLDKDKAIKKIERECSLKSLGFAEELLRKQEFQQAKKLARTNESADPERAWKIIGRAACILRDGPSVLEALVKLLPYPASGAEVREECRLNHVDIHSKP